MSREKKMQKLKESTETKSLLCKREGKRKRLRKTIICAEAYGPTNMKIRSHRCGFDVNVKHVLLSTKQAKQVQNERMGTFSHSTI